MMLALQPGHYRLLGYLLVLSIIALSLIPGDSLPKLSWDQVLGLDKLFHFFSYGLACFCFLKSSQENANFKIGMALFSMGFLLECLQKILPGGRFFDLADLGANLAGILVGVCVFKVPRKKD